MALCVLCVSAAAQEERNELTGTIGRMFISDQGLQGPSAPAVNPFIHSGHGLTFEVSYARRLFGKDIYALFGEIPAAFNFKEKLNSGGNVVPTQYSQVFVTPALRLNLFPATAVSPWASIGGGFAHFSESDQLIYGGTNPGGSTTSGVLEAGAGLDINPFEHRLKNLGFRLAFRDFWSGEPDFPLADTGKTRQHNYYVGGGVVWHF